MTAPPWGHKPPTEPSPIEELRAIVDAWRATATPEELNLAAGVVEAALHGEVFFDRAGRVVPRSAPVSRGTVTG